MYQCAVALQTRVVPSHQRPEDRAMPNENHVMRGIRSVASRQWGCITVRQLLAAGLTRRQIECMAERGQLIRMHRGVYVLGALSPAPEQRWAAALLAGGKGAALSHTASAGNFCWLQPRAVIEISAPRKRRGDERLTVHRRASIDVTKHNGLPTTTVAQTLLDLAAAGWSIDRFTQEAAATGQISLDDLRAFAASRRGARGAPALLAAAGQPLIRSRMEYEA
ncbi:MAG: hypothetical protein E6G41_13310, partial [Actinobacteria bacterium]